MLLAAAICVAPTVIDGDSLRCRNLGEVRLLGIDAADRTSSWPCREGYGDHVCDDRTAASAKASLRRAMLVGSIRVTPVTRDRYGRMVAQVRAGSRDLSCWQLERRQARYLLRYDNGGRIRSTCPAAAR